MSRLQRLLQPKSIVAIGGMPAQRVIEQCQLMGYSGEIWAVHPDKHEMHGLPVYRCIDELPGSPDAAFIGVNRHLCIPIIQQLVAKGCGGAICYASGFQEADDTGAQLQQQLIDAAAGMPVLGPNCYGFINYADGIPLWPDQQGGKALSAGQTGVAIIAQSSNIAINFSMQQRALPLAFLATVGNQALVGMSELASTLLDDPRVTCLGLYIEGFDSITAMQQLAEKSRALKKPIVVFKVGKTSQSQQAALTHSASMVGSHQIASAFIKRLGFGQADSIPVFLETLKLLHLHGPLDGYRVSSMSCSGGEASIIADAASEMKIHFPKLKEDHKTSIEQTLAPQVGVANPLDYHTYCWGKRELMQATYTSMLSGDFDLNYLILDFPHQQRCDDRDWKIAVDAFEAALKTTEAKGAIVVSMAENLPEKYAENFAESNIVSFCGIDEALDASEIAANIGMAWKAKAPERLIVLDPLALNQFDNKTITLNEAQAKMLLSGAGVKIPTGEKICSIEQALKLAVSLQYPLALKALGIAHKTEQNAVHLNLNNDTELTEAAKLLFKLGDQLYLEKMLRYPIAELVIGITRDPQFGLVLSIGSGGVLVEILKDHVTLLLPTKRDEIFQALESLKSHPLLMGYRGKPKADMALLLDSIMAMHDFAILRARDLIELEVNPLLIQEQAIYAADALIVLQENP